MVLVMIGMCAQDTGWQRQQTAQLCVCPYPPIFIIKIRPLESIRVDKLK